MDPPRLPHPSLHWAYPQQWPSPHVYSQSTAPSVTPANHAHPPPYQPSQPRPPAVVIVDGDEFSDGEEPDVELVEDNDGEVDEPRAAQVSSNAHL